MKIAFITDMHLAEDPLRPGQIYKHQAAGIDEVLEGVSREEPDLIFLGGDNSGHGIPHYARPAERNAHVKLRQGLCEIADVFEIEGNHDVPGDYAFFSKIKTSRSYHLQPSNTFEVINRREGLICLLPWQFQNVAGGSHIEEVRAVIAQLNAKIDDYPAFLLGHCAINEGFLREGQPKVPVKDPVISIDEFDWTKIEAGFFGHYHYPQHLNERAIYGGSLFTNEYGESFERGWHIWDSDEELEDRFRLIVVDSQRPKIKILYDWIEDVVVRTEPDLDIEFNEGDFEECLVKLDVIGAADTRAEVDLRASRVNTMKSFISDVLKADGVSAKYPKKPARESRRVSKGVSEGKSLESRVEAFLRDHDYPRQSDEVIARAIEIYRSL